MSDMAKHLTQLGLLKEYFQANPNRNIPHAEIVDWATSEWLIRKGDDNPFRDPDRGIRSLHQQGFLIKADRGVYRYSPGAVKQVNSELFTNEQKSKILERDGFKCVICGRSREYGVDLHVDHIKPRDLGGKATIENGQTLCAQHNFLKKNLQQTETGKKMFIRLYELSKANNNEFLQKFCADILRTYEKHDINGHIEWNE